VIFRNMTDGDLDLPTLGLHVPAHQTVVVTGEDAKQLMSNPAFERVDEPKPRAKHADDESDDAADD
jgi:hypothetical protein